MKVHLHLDMFYVNNVFLKVGLFRWFGLISRWAGLLVSMVTSVEMRSVPAWLHFLNKVINTCFCFE